MYCSIESNLQDWPQFVLHTRQAHPIDDADVSLSDQCENEVKCPKEEPHVPYEDSKGIKEENHTWQQDDEEFYVGNVHGLMFSDLYVSQFIPYTVY